MHGINNLRILHGISRFQLILTFHPGILDVHELKRVSEPPILLNVEAMTRQSKSKIINCC